MHPLRKQRLQLVILIVVAATIVVGLVLYMLRENGNFFYTPEQIISGEAPQDVYLRAGGMVLMAACSAPTTPSGYSFRLLTA